MFRFVAAVFQTHTSAMTAGSLAVFLQFVFGGFIITQRKVIIPLLQSHSNITS